MIPFTKVATAGTPVQLITPAVAERNVKRAKRIVIQAHHDNTGLVFIGMVGLVKATFVQVLFVLGIPTATTIDSHIIEMEGAPNGILIEDLFIDVGVSTDGVVGYYLVN